MIKKILKPLLWTLLALILFMGLYLLAAYALPHLKVNTAEKNSGESIKIAVISNGVHTDIAVPAITRLKDWTQAFPPDSFDVKDANCSYIGFGWGDKGFYLYTPTWDDLKFSTAFKAATGLSETAMHVRYLKEKKRNSEHCAILTLDSSSYKTLVHYIESSFEKKENNPIKLNHPGYGDMDRFYEAKGTYSLFKTCNCWTTNGLKATGLQVGLWCPFAAGLMNSLRR